MATSGINFPINTQETFLIRRDPYLRLRPCEPTKPLFCVTFEWSKQVHSASNWLSFGKLVAKLRLLGDLGAPILMAVARLVTRGAMRRVETA